MKKTVKSLVLGGSLAALAFLPGCLGSSAGASSSFCLVRKNLKMNREITDNKWINEILFIIPGYLVHGIATFRDVIIFNSFEFWTGENPIASTTITDPNGTEYYVQKDNQSLKITNVETQEAMNFVFDEATQTWFVLDDQGEKHKLVAIK